jgi:hypothetical protein
MYRYLKKNLAASSNRLISRFLMAGILFGIVMAIPTLAAIKPTDGPWAGTTSRGYPMSFTVQSTGTQWADFKLKTDIPYGWVEVTVYGPGTISSSAFSWTNGSNTYTFTGNFSSTTAATGTYSFNNYKIYLGGSSYYYLTQSGTWNATYTAPPPAPKDDFVGTWDGQGVFYRNSDTAAWVKLATAAEMIAVGDLDGDDIDDLIGVWAGQGGVWAKYSEAGTWAKLGSTPTHIATGDMNGDGRVDLLGTWDGQGVFYKDSVGGNWVKMATAATLITAGDLDGDSIDDLIGIWPGQGGVWAKYSNAGTWSRLSTTAVDIAAGDMNGDDRVDFLATWDGQGVYYLDSIGSSWVKMSSSASQVTAGDLDGDEVDDLIGIWPTQGGVWAKYSEDGSWSQLSETASDLAAGKMRSWDSSSLAEGGKLYRQTEGMVEGPETRLRLKDQSAEGPGGWRFAYQEEKNLIPQARDVEAMAAPGPGDPGFTCIEQTNLVPQAVEQKREQGTSKTDSQKKKNK